MDRSDLQTTTTEVLGPKLDQLRLYGTAAAVVGLVVAIVASLSHPAVFFEGYLWAYLFWLGPTAGSLGILMLHHVVGGGWGFILRRFLEAGVKMLPIMLLMFIPIALSLFVLD